MSFSLPNEEADLKSISEFKKGYPHFLTQFQNLASSLLNFLSSGGVTEATKKELLPFRKQIDQEIIKTIQIAKDLNLELDEKHLLPIAKKMLVQYFQDGAPDVHRIEFVIFHKSFESLREFYIVGKESWNVIKHAVLSAHISDENFKSEAILEYRVIPVLKKLESLKILLTRMAYMLKIEDQDKIFSTKYTKPQYNESSNYKLSGVFQEGLYTLEEETDDFLPSFSSPQESSQSSTNEKVSVKEVIKQRELKSQDNILNTSGKMSWNSNQHYYFRYEPQEYEEERNLFQSVINMDIHMGADEKALRSELIRSLTSRAKNQRSAMELELEYYSFLNRFFQFCRDILMMSIGIPESLKYLFFYHIGAQHFYMIVRKFLQEANTGYLHIRSSDGKKVSKVLPNEILKKLVIDYWKIEILPFISEDANNLAALKKIIEFVDQKYKVVSQHAMLEYENLPDDIRRSKPKVQLFREHMNQWMGAANIIVFKRFLKTAL
ncbi:hypothetical protein [Leptospira sp. GIMC2001]|uniref:hypothetical protein n=1 Tax=Leptospira sp. GIMC2001 TaxID=1513297 RepID=UPI00234A8F4B|nr:hypothetical protein [Leptospira sp. GIMC2001]WCL50113.1 hypothetical protein O4O04_04655 [Leptospira sp. GIMC2001]